MRRALRLLPLPALGLLVGFSGADAQASLRQAFDLRVPMAPTPVPVAGRPLLVYELHLTNFASEPLVLEQVEVLDIEAVTGPQSFTGLIHHARVKDWAPRHDRSLITIADLVMIASSSAAKRRGTCFPPRLSPGRYRSAKVHDEPPAGAINRSATRTRIPVSIPHNTEPASTADTGMKH
jgi:hypothetical protein